MKNILFLIVMLVMEFNIQAKVYQYMCIRKENADASAPKSSDTLHSYETTWGKKYDLDAKLSAIIHENEEKILAGTPLDTKTRPAQVNVLKQCGEQALLYQAKRQGSNVMYAFKGRVKPIRALSAKK